MCLPDGGTPNPSKPPPDTDCPSKWSWLPVKGCCAPHSPPENQPPPQCANNWKWNSGSLCCKPPPTPPATTKPPAPSRTPGKNNHGDDDDDDDDNHGHGNGNGGGHGHKRLVVEKRQNRSRNFTPCPKGLSACPVVSLMGGDYECVDTLLDLDHCGGCSTLGEGENCNAIPGVWNVGCEQSTCISEFWSFYPGAGRI